MNGKALGELMTTYDELRGVVAQAQVVAQSSFDDLARTIRARLSHASARIASMLGETEAHAVLAPLVFWLDEAVQRQWSYLGLDWPLLQQSEFQRGDGGDAFFDEVARLLGNETPEPVVVASYLLALREGFEGRYAEQPEQLQSVRSKLAGCLPEQDWCGRKHHRPRMPRARPTWVVWAPLLGLPLLVHLLLAWAAALW
jgi:type VI protein secretion system component VasF